MTPAQIDLIQTSFHAVSSKGSELVKSFYESLFADHPELREMFPHDMEEQQEKLLQTLAYAVNGLKHPEALLPIVRNLGVSHKGFRVESEHYTYVAAALLGALRTTLGPAFTRDVESAWVACYVLLSREMETAAEAA